MHRKKSQALLGQKQLYIKESVQYLNIDTSLRHSEDLMSITRHCTSAVIYNSKCLIIVIIRNVSSLMYIALHAINLVTLHFDRKTLHIFIKFIFSINKSIFLNLITLLGCKDIVNHNSGSYNRDHPKKFIIECTQNAAGFEYDFRPTSGVVKTV